MHNKKLLLTFIITLISFNVSSQEIIEIKSSGYGASEMEAIKNARRNAIEQTLGVYISSRTLVRNDELVSDRISSISDGEILNSKLLESTKLSEGGFFVVINVKLSKSEAASYFNRNSESAIEFQGNLFSNNIEIIDLNKLSEINSIKNLLELSEKYLANLVNYEINEAGLPQVKSDNLFEVDYTINGITNINIIELQTLFINSLQKISLKSSDWKRLKKYGYKRYSKNINYGEIGNETFYFRDKKSIKMIDDFENLLRVSYSNFHVLVNDKKPSFQNKLKLIKSSFDFFNFEGEVIGTWSFKATLNKKDLRNFKISTNKQSVTTKKSTTDLSKKLNQLVIKGNKKNSFSYYVNLGAYSINIDEYNFPIIDYIWRDQRDGSTTSFDINPNIFPVSGTNFYISPGIRINEFLDFNIMYGFGKINLENPTIYYSENYFKYYTLETSASVILFNSSRKFRPYIGLSYGSIVGTEITQYYQIPDSNAISAFESGYTKVQGYKNKSSSNYYGLNIGVLYNLKELWNLRNIDFKPEIVFALGGDIDINSYFKLGLSFKLN